MQLSESTATSSITPVAEPFPSGVPDAVRQQLDPGENVLAWLEVDLDEQLHFKPQDLVLSNRRLLSWRSAHAQIQYCAGGSSLTLRHNDHGGVSEL